MLLTARKVGWSMTFLSYFAAGTIMSIADSNVSWLGYICLLIIFASVVVNVFFAIKLKNYDLWSAAFFSLISLPTLFIWTLPFFSEHNRQW